MKKKCSKKNTRVKFKLFVLLLFLIGANPIWSQEMTISGIVTSDTDTEPIAGVSVAVKGTTKGTITDAEGRYQIETSVNSSLEFRLLSYVTQTIKVGEKIIINIVLKEDNKLLDEIMVVGYGRQRKREVTGAIASIKSEDLQKIGGSNFADALQGQLAGVNIQASSGAPGANSNIQIRGIGSLSAGALNPLFVVDGIPYDGNPNITSSEIESVEVLKDAASASIYGTRASNGVILITTKRGKAGEMKIDVDGYYGFQKITSGIELMNTKNYLYAFNVREALNNAPGETIWNPLEQNTDGLNYNTNWMKELTNDNAPIQNYSINVSGGKENLTYNVVVNYFDQVGSMIKTDYKALTLRSNAYYKKGNFTAFISLGVNKDTRNITPWGMHDNAIALTPMSVPLDFNATSGIVPGNDSAPVGALMNSIKEENKITNNGNNQNIDLGYELIEGLKVNAMLGLSSNTGYSKVFNPQFLIYDSKGILQSGGNHISKLAEDISMSERYSVETTLKYDKKLEGGHSINLLSGFSFEESKWDVRKWSKQGFPNNEIQVPDAGTSGDRVGGTNSTNALVGMLARAMYNYNDKYMASVSIRRDGSSRFGSQKWANFPSLSLGWGINEEQFFKQINSNNVVESLKLRASLGTAGNQSIPNYAYEANIYNNLDYVLGMGDQSHVMQGAIQRGFANPLVQWETSISRNIGLDLVALRGALSFSADYYHTNKKDMLLPVALAPSSGVPSGDWQFGDVQLNAGDMYNKGVELSLTYKGAINEFKYSLSGVFSKNSNKITRTYVPSNYLSGGVPIIGRQAEATTYIKEGYSAGSFFLVPNKGTIKTENQLAEYQKVVSTAKLGDLWLEDTDGNGSLNDDDRVFCGSGTPDWEAGLTMNFFYKQLDINVQIYGTSGSKVYNGSKLYAYTMLRHQDLVYAWTPWNPTSNVPTPRKEIEHNNVRSISDYFLEDGSYLRIRNIQLGYTLPTKLCGKLKARNIRVYVSVQNPIIFTKYTGYDPEVGGDGLFMKGVDRGNYPVSAQYRFGFQLGF
ncbi:MAG: hypothetical protein RL662_1349 [Bacteroidota bacterium]|jgi:TonB-linked SusC/RagA family outer membrane protein